MWLAQWTRRLPSMRQWACCRRYGRKTSEWVRRIGWPSEFLGLSHETISWASGVSSRQSKRGEQKENGRGRERKSKQPALSLSFHTSVGRDRDGQLSGLSCRASDPVRSAGHSCELKRRSERKNLLCLCSSGAVSCEPDWPWSSWVFCAAPLGRMGELEAWICIWSDPINHGRETKSSNAALATRTSLTGGAISIYIGAMRWSTEGGERVWGEPRAKSWALGARGLRLEERRTRSKDAARNSRGHENNDSQFVCGRQTIRCLRSLGRRRLARSLRRIRISFWAGESWSRRNDKFSFSSWL